MKKNRNISKLSYFVQLQKEYISCEVRSVVYFKPNDKKYWRKVCRLKKDKIVSLSKELEVESIFDSEQRYNDLKKVFFNKGIGPPKFQYKLDGSDYSLKETDLINYYSLDSEIIYLPLNILGTITDVKKFDLLNDYTLHIRTIHSNNIKVSVSDIYRPI